MTSENAIKNQIKAYRNSARVPSLDFEPNEDSCSVSEFADYCFDLGQMTAAYYALAKFNLLEQKFKKVNNLHDFRNWTVILKRVTITLKSLLM